MTKPFPARSPALGRIRSSIAVALVVLAGIGTWRLLTRGSEHAQVHDDPSEAATTFNAPPALEPAPPATTKPGNPAIVSATALNPQPSINAPESLNVVAPAPDAPHEPGMVPHPLDAAHARIHAENRLNQSLNDAMSFRRVSAMRELLADYKTLDPTDVDATQAGYAVIADCIEFPGEASLTAARDFYDTERHSPLRRFVRRICFENSN